VAVEGIYSMDGDMAPLDEIIPLCNKYNAFLVLDDAHGTGVVGEKGEGTHSLFPQKADHHLTVGTFSKTFAVTGGFIAGSRDMICYLRYCARSYMFSAALPPISLATILSEFEIIEEENWRIAKLHANVRYLTDHLGQIGFYGEPMGGIIAIKIPTGADIRAMAHNYHKAGIFVNAIEYPAVSLNKQRFRISCNSNHTKADLDRLIEVTDSIYRPYM
jgi:glycine C-acetyltransferase